MSSPTHDDSDHPFAPFRMTLVQMDHKCHALVHLLRVPIGSLLPNLATDRRAVLMCLLVASGRFGDAFFCLLSVVLYAICTREAGYFNFSCIVLLHIMSCIQLFFSSFRLLMLQVGTADEMAPPESKSQFAVFAVGVVAAPLIHATSAYFGWRLHQQLRYTLYAQSLEHGGSVHDAHASHDHSAVAPASPSLVLSPSPSAAGSQPTPAAPTGNSATPVAIGASSGSAFKPFSGSGHRLGGDDEG